jgi:uncharacterized protein
VTSVIRVHDNTAAQRFEIEVGADRAYLQYEREADSIVLLHTEVPETLKGQGLASVLARAALDASRAEGLRIVVVCPFVRNYMRKHPDA